MKGYQLYQLYEQINEENNLGVDPWESLSAKDHLIWDQTRCISKGGLMDKTPATQEQLQKLWIIAAVGYFRSLSCEFSDPRFTDRHGDAIQAACFC